jgi:hypothetical protein
MTLRTAAQSPKREENGQTEVMQVLQDVCGAETRLRLKPESMSRI